MRWLLLLVTACATSAPPRAPEPLGHHAVPRPAPPPGMFVGDLMSHRVDAGDARPMIVLARATPPNTPLVVLPRRAFATPVVTVEYCIDDTGRVTSVRAAGALTPRDRAEVERMHAWRFAPYFADGKPIAVCSFYSFESSAY